MADSDLGLQIHVDIVGCGLENNVLIGSTIMDLYAKCGSLVDTRLEFLRLPYCNLECIDDRVYSARVC